MPDPAVEQQEQKPVKRFTTYEEFLKEFYPKSSEQQAQQQTENNGEFGVELAFDSLNRHAEALRFGDA
jgi:hypothetical protein